MPRIVGCGWISSEFVKDIVRSRPEKVDVAHAIVAVGARDKTKAQEFIDKYSPNGGSAQQQNVFQAGPIAVGSYDEVFRNEVEHDVMP